MGNFKYNGFLRNVSAFCTIDINRLGISNTNPITKFLNITCSMEAHHGVAIYKNKTKTKFTGIMEIGCYFSKL